MHVVHLERFPAHVEDLSVLLWLCVALSPTALCVCSRELGERGLPGSTQALLGGEERALPQRGPEEAHGAEGFPAAGAPHVHHALYYLLGAA